MFATHPPIAIVDARAFTSGVLGGVGMRSRGLRMQKNEKKAGGRGVWWLDSLRRGGSCDVGFEEREVRCWVSSLRASGIILVSRLNGLDKSDATLFLNDWPPIEGGSK